MGLIVAEDLTLTQFVTILPNCKKRMWEMKEGKINQKKIESHILGTKHLSPAELWYNNSSLRTM